MRSVISLGSLPVGLPLVADDIVEFHAARIILLIGICGTNNRIDGLTKLAKLDFFVRYPQFFEMASSYMKTKAISASKTVESNMIRYHYGPWDPRYYNIFAYLESRDLLEITKEDKTFRFQLTDLGKEALSHLKKNSAYYEISEQMQSVKKAFGSKKGSKLKELIYQVFEKEVTQKQLGEIIKQ